MAGNAAYVKKLQVSDDNITYEDVPVKNPSFNVTGDPLDDTDLATNAGYKSKLIGLLDYTADAPDIVYDHADAAVVLIATAFFARTPLYIKYLYDGTNGYKGKGKVTSFNLSGAVEGLENLSCSIVSDGTALVAVP